MLRHRTYPSGGVGRIAVLALTVVIAVALLLVLTCSAVDIPVMQPKLENATVDPGTTSNWDQSFTYAVNCIFSDKVSITLEVYSLSLHDWTARGDRTYNGTGEWQSLTWEDLKICSGKCEGTSSYRFKYNGSILLTESGPTIAPPTPTLLPPTVQVFKNASVKPAYGHYNDSFTYSVFAQLNQTTNITLEVFDISSYEWKEAGENQSYTETGEWQLLSWAEVTNVSAVDSAGVASYRFFFFDAGERRESEVFYGPELGLYPTPTPTPTVIYSGGGGGGGGVSWRRLLEIEKRQKELAENLSSFITAEGEEKVIMPQLVDLDVTPDNGSWNKSYNYSVVVVHPNRAERWLTLEVYCPGKGVTRIISNQKINNYTEKYLYNWNVSGNDSKEELERALRDNFRIDWVEDANINKSNDNRTIYITKDDDSAEIIMDEKKEKATLKISDDQTYELKVKTENGKLKIYYVNAVVEWREVNVFSKEDARANESPRFYIYFTEGYNNVILEKSVPKLNYPPLLSHPTVSPGNGTVGDSFEYKVNVMDKDADNNVNVTLYIVDPEGEKKEGDKTEINATAARNGTTALFRYKFTKKDDAGKTFGFYFSANDTIDVEKVEGEGPSITDGIDEAEKVWGEGTSIESIIRVLSLWIIAGLFVIALSVIIVTLLKHRIVRWWRYIKGIREIEEELVYHNE
jgi:hypothetical protein